VWLPLEGDVPVNVNVPQYLQAFENCHAEGCQLSPYYDPKRLVTGFHAVKLLEDGSEEIREFELRASSIRDHYRQQTPVPEGAVVKDGWVQQTLPLEDFLRERREETIRVSLLFRRDVHEAAERGRRRLGTT
jgi:hypothetical protein